jgi:hypothetical protein
MYTNQKIETKERAENNALLNKMETDNHFQKRGKTLAKSKERD